MATNIGGSSVAVILGNGDGSFNAPVLYPVGSGPWNVVVGDINNDGLLDLAVASDGTGNVSVLLGNGDGTFQPASYVPVGSSQVGSVAVGDFNGDGYLDLATTSAPDNSVYVLLNNGTAGVSFAAPVKYPMSSGPYYLTLGDFNRDGHLDIISANGGSTNVGVLDVYKRQIKAQTRVALFEDPVAAKWAVAFRQRLKHFPAVFGDHDAAGREPVSYTHLDVYKRQPPPRCSPVFKLTSNSSSRSVLISQPSPTRVSPRTAVMRTPSQLSRPVCQALPSRPQASNE